MSERRVVVCVSDHTGLTAATFARSLVARFDGLEASYLLRPFVDSQTKVDAVVTEVNNLAVTGLRPIVFSTLTDAVLWQRLREANALVLGLFEHFVDTLAEELHIEPGHTVGVAHSIRDTSLYQVRLDALDFSLTTDDGLGVRHYGSADLIVIGVSRAGKTPACVYMSMQYGLRAANYPLTMDELSGGSLPDSLQSYRPMLFALTIDPVRLHQIRQKRRPDSDYSSISRCTEEIGLAERLFRQEGIPTVDTTTHSIEEITSTIMEVKGLTSRLD